MVKVAEVMRQHQILVYPIIICEQFDVIVNIHRSFKGDDKIWNVNDIQQLVMAKAHLAFDQWI